MEEGTEKDDSDDLFRLYKFLRAFCWRDKAILCPLWKRPDQYERFAKEVFSASAQGSPGPDDAIADFNEALSRSYSTYLDSGTWSSEDRDHRNRKFCVMLETEIGNHIDAFGIRANVVYYSHFKPVPDELVLLNDSEEVPLEVLSPSVTSLTYAWKGLPHLWIFLENRHIEPVSISDDIFRAVATAIASVVER